MSTERDELRIPVVEETVQMGVRKRQTGSVKIRTHVDAEHLLLKQDLHESRVDIRRVPINQKVDRAPAERMEGTTRVLPVFEERLVIVKELWLVEELHISRHDAVEQVTVPVDRRTTRVEIERN